MLEPALSPLGFDWRIGMALVPTFAAREVMVSTLATVYAVEGRTASGDSFFFQAEDGIRDTAR